MTHSRIARITELRELIERLEDRLSDTDSKPMTELYRLAILELRAEFRVCSGLSAGDLPTESVEI